MNMEIRKNQPGNIAETIMTIKALEQQILQGGNVDSEKDKFKDVLSRLENQQIAPEAALNEINIMINQRQDYH